MRTVALAGVASSFLLSAPGGTVTNDPLQGLDFLLGEWHVGPPSRAGDVFHRDLGGKILVRRARSDVGDGANAMQTSMTIYDDPQTGLKAIYFDNLGHVIHYGLNQLTPGRSVQFESVGGPGPHFRLTYSAYGNRQLSVRFETAPPGENTEYKVVAEGTEKRIHP